MKLNPDCIRDIMLVIESFECIGDDLEYKTMDISDFEANPEVSRYKKSAVFYTLQKLEEADFINGEAIDADDGILNYYVFSLTFPGHEYLEKIRNVEKWKKVKAVGSKIGDFSLSAIEKIAEGMTAAALKQCFK